MMKAVRWAVMVCTGAALLACGGSDSTTGTNNNNNNAATINATNADTFNPSTLTVTAGTTVTFVFQQVTHNVTFVGSGAPANIPDAVNTSVTRTFPTAGTFNFTCTLHPGMAGTVVVTAGP